MNKNNNKFKFIKFDMLEGVMLLEAEMHNFTYKNHSHSEYSIGVTRKGVQSFNSKGSSYKVTPNGLITFNPGDVHDGYSELESGLRYQMIYIDSKVIDKIAREMCGDKFNNVYFKNTVHYDDKTAYNILDFFSVLKRKNDNNRCEIQTKFYDAMTPLLKNNGIFCKMPINIYKDNTLVKKACNYIKVNADKNISLYEIADSVSLSPYHFSRLFKKTTSFSPHNYLNQCRVQIVREKLNQGISLAEIALYAGFSDQSHMNRRFKEVYGVTPGQYKEALR